MPSLPSSRIRLYVAINDRGDHVVSEIGPEHALRALVTEKGGRAYRVVDIDLDVLHADATGAEVVDITPAGLRARGPA